MAQLPIYTFNHPVLRKRARLVKRPLSDLAQAADDMLETMYKANGVGLAANQVGLLQRLIVVDMTGSEGVEKFEPLKMYNPEVVEEEGKWLMEEGCLSLPGIAGDVVRPSAITLHYRDEKFEEHTADFHGMMARVLLHEIDHLDGKLFVDRMDKRDRRKIQKELDAIAEGRVKADYPLARDASRVEAEA